MYDKASETVQIPINGNFFGWGSDGSSNITKIATILKDLGYQKVVAAFFCKNTIKIQDNNRY